MRKIMLAIGSLLSATAWAQDSLKTKELQEVVVSASRTDQSILEVPRNVSVINRDVIEKTAYNSVGELLNTQSGIYVVGANQTPGTNQTVFMRGANSNQMVVLIDGMRITDPSSPNGAVDLSEISLADVERVEIIRGAHTTMYGGAAIGGVINIITRKDQKKGIHGNASVQAGTFGSKTSSFTEQVDLNYTFENGVFLTGSLWQQNVNGLNASLKDPEQSTFTTSDKDNFRKTDGYVKAGYRKNKWDGFVAYKKTNQRADIDKGAFSDDDNSYLDFERDLLDYQVRYTLSDLWSISAIGSYSRLLRENVNDSSVINESGDTDKSFFRGTYHGKLYTNELQFNYDSKKIKALLGGGLYKENMFFDTYYFSDAFGPYESIVDYDSINSSATTAYAFGKLSYDFDGFNIAAGTRFSNHSVFGNYLTYELSPSYRWNTLLIYVSLSSGYNAPSLYQIYDPTKDFGSVTTRGNKDLGAEESVSIEAGVKHEFNNGSYITFSAFRNVVKNSIEYVYLWNGAKAIEELDYTDYRGDTYINIASQTTQGIEVTGKLIMNQRLNIQGNVTLLRGEITFSPDDIDEALSGNHIQLYSYGAFLNNDVKVKDLVRRPKVTSNIQVNVTPVDKLGMSLIYRYTGSRNDSGYDPALGPYGALTQSSVESYGLLDFNALWTLNKNLFISMRIENMLDEDYSEIQGFQTRGRSFYLKTILKW